MANVDIWHERTSESASMRSPIPTPGDLATYRAVTIDVPCKVLSIDPDAVTAEILITATRGAFPRGYVTVTHLNFLTLRTHNGRRRRGRYAYARAFD